MDRFIALILFILTSPILIVISLINLMLNGSPIYFPQKRVGYKREAFTIYKIRTMERSRVHSFGKILRKTGLDELPQLINIIKGDMSFIGPRPLTEDDITRLEWNSSGFDIRWSVNPGITGLSQLSNICSKDNSWKLDKFYVENRSLGLNFKIAFKTLIKAIRGRSEVR